MNNTTKKGFTMALPFLAGIALGSLAVVAWNKRDKIKECASEGLAKGKEAADKIYAKGVSLASEVVGEKAKGTKRKRRTPAEMAEARALEAAQKGKKRSRARAKKAPAKAEQPAPIVAPEIA